MFQAQGASGSAAIGCEVPYPLLRVQQVGVLPKEPGLQVDGMHCPSLGGQDCSP